MINRVSSKLVFKVSPAALAKEVLAEVLNQLTDYFRARNILPQQRPNVNIP